MVSKQSDKISEILDALERGLSNAEIIKKYHTEGKSVLTTVKRVRTVSTLNPPRELLTRALGAVTTAEQARIDSEIDIKEGSVDLQSASRLKWVFKSLLAGGAALAILGLAILPGRFASGPALPTATGKLDDAVLSLERDFETEISAVNTELAEDSAEADNINLASDTEYEELAGINEEF